MGSLLSRWRRKLSTIDVLEKLDKDIGYLERSKRTDVERQKRLIGSLILYSVILYVVVALIFYFYYMPSDWRGRILSSLPMLTFPFIVWLVKRFLHWYFVKRIHKNDLALEELKGKKKQILDEVMEKETYKKAKEILERFAPENKVQLSPSSPTHSPRANSSQGVELRQRNVGRPAVAGNPTSSVSPGGLSPNALPVTTPQRELAANGRQHATISPNGQSVLVNAPTLPQPVLPRDRTIVDRLVEYLVGDGPQNRYALICHQCHSHNGMALREEFQYISFRCCYCYAMNEARKQKPKAPPLEPMEHLDDPFNEQAQNEQRELASHVVDPGTVLEESMNVDVTYHDDSNTQAASDDTTSAIHVMHDTADKKAN